MIKQIIERLDREPAPAKFAQQLAYRLMKRIPLQDDLAQEAINQYESHFSSSESLGRLRNVLAEHMKVSSNNRIEPKYYLIAAVLPTSEKLDGYGLEYFVQWSEELGLPEAEFVEICWETDIKPSGSL